MAAWSGKIPINSRTNATDSAALSKRIEKLEKRVKDLKKRIKKEA